MTYRYPDLSVRFYLGALRGEMLLDFFFIHDLLDVITMVNHSFEDFGSLTLEFGESSHIFSSDEKVGPRIPEHLSEVSNSGLRAHISN